MESLPWPAPPELSEAPDIDYVKPSPAVVPIPAPRTVGPRVECADAQDDHEWSELSEKDFESFSYESDGEREFTADEAAHVRLPEPEPAKVPEVAHFTIIRVNINNISK